MRLILINKPYNMCVFSCTTPILPHIYIINMTTVFIPRKWLQATTFNLKLLISDLYSCIKLKWICYSSSSLYFKTMTDH